MNHCLKCNKETSNPKFCSHSCSASYNNTGKRRSKQAPKQCLACQKKCQNKYCSQKCQQSHLYATAINRIEETQTFPKSNSYKSSTYCKKYLIQKYGNKCSICGLESWQDKPITLILDHIDGNFENLSVSNYRLVCPNCDSQLPTFKGRNKGNGRHLRKMRYHNNQSF